MKKVLLAICTLFITGGLFAQCSDLFISEYIEGSNNNKALEIYNPTSSAINLSGYAIGRFSNGSTTTANTNGDPVVLPNVMLAPYDAYVIVLDRRTENGTGFDLPVWNGYNIFETAIDSLTGDPLIDFCTGEPRLFVQYVDDNSDNSFDYSTTYDALYDLQGKADTFACPDYNANSHMSYNGNDAVFLISGSTVANDGSNILDVIGVIGEDPQNTIGQPAWVDNNNKWVTRDITIVRNSTTQGGTGIVAAITGVQDTLAYSEWDYYCNNDFSNLGSHGCDCDPNFVGVNEVLNEVSVAILPNPAEDWVLVNAMEAIQQVELFDMMGRRMYNEIFSGQNNEVRLNTNHLEAGMYIVNVHFDDNKRTIRKLIIQ